GGHVRDAELLQVPRRRQVALRELPEHGLREALLLVRAEAELQRGVAVALAGADLRDGARARLDHGHGHDVALLVEDLRHADFASNQSHHFRKVLSRRRTFESSPFGRLEAVAPYCACYVLISISTPAGMSSFSSASMVWPVERVMSISRLWMRISNCSRDFLSTCGLRSTVYTVLRVGSGTGPDVTAPVRRAVRTISAADWSSVAWSYDFNLMRIF